MGQVHPSSIRACNGSHPFFSTSPLGPSQRNSYPVLGCEFDLSLRSCSQLPPSCWLTYGPTQRPFCDDQHDGNSLKKKKKKKRWPGGDSGRNTFQAQRNVFCLLPCIKDPEAKRNRLLVEEHEESLKEIPWDTGKFSSLSEFRCMGVLIL